MNNKLDFIYDSDVFIDLYTLLNVDMEAKSEEIRNGYLKLVKEHHPDHGGNPEMFQQITKAYEILHNKESRKEYDLYYLKKSMDEFRGDDITRLKSDYKNFIDANTKPISKEKLDEIYGDMFKDREKYVEEVITNDDLKKRINDRNMERETENIETIDDKLLNIINDINKKSDVQVSVSDFFEYIKYKNQSNNSGDIVVGELGTLDTLPGYGSNYTSFMSENEFFGSNLYSDIGSSSEISTSFENFNNVDIEEFNRWKSGKRADIKLSQSELENYLEKRRLEEEEIFNEVEHNLGNKSKKKEIEKFLKTKHLSEDVDEYYNKLHDKKDKSENSDKLDKLDKLHKLDKTKNMGSETEDILEFMDQVKKEKVHLSNSTDETMEFLERTRNEKASNVRKREFK